VTFACSRRDYGNDPNLISTTSESSRIHRTEGEERVLATMAEADLTPKFAPFLGMGGIAFAMIFGCKI